MFQTPQGPVQLNLAPAMSDAASSTGGASMTLCRQSLEAWRSACSGSSGTVVLVSVVLVSVIVVVLVPVVLVSVSVVELDSVLVSVVLVSVLVAVVLVSVSVSVASTAPATANSTRSADARNRKAAISADWCASE